MTILKHVTQTIKGRGEVLQNVVGDIWRVPAHFYKAEKLFTGNTDDCSEAVGDINAQVDAAMGNMTNMPKDRSLTKHPYAYLDFTGADNKPKVADSLNARQHVLAAVKSWHARYSQEPSVWQV